MSRTAVSALFLLFTVAGACQLAAQSRLPRPSRPVTASNPVTTSSPTSSPGSGAEASASPESPLHLVAVFLQLSSDQLESLEKLIQARQESIVPLVHKAQERESKLNSLIDAGGPESDIGTIVLEIHALQEQVAHVQQDFLSQFVALLDTSQRERLQAVHVAAALKPAVPAFEILNLL